MNDPKYALGIDFGTGSARAIIVDTADGSELATATSAYAHGEDGVIVDPKDPHLARQHPQDYHDSCAQAVRAALSEAARHPGFNPDQIVGIGVDTTGSTPIPVDSSGTPLGLLPQFASNPNAMAWLWKDHTSHAEAAEITRHAQSTRAPYLAKCGGTYSSEWFWSKILHCCRIDAAVFAAAHSWVELQDYVPAWLTGNTDPAQLIRGVCAAGHKAMYHPDWGGLPSEAFLQGLDPRLADLRSRLYERAVPADHLAGHLTPERAEAMGLPQGIPVAVGAFDAHLGAVGAGVQPGTLVKIMGTSTCDIMVGDAATPDIPGVCGVVPGSVLPDMLGIEAGQSAVGDLFNWWSAKVAGQSHQDLSAAAATLKPGESGLLALDWNNGNRTVLVDPMLTGLLVGQTLHTSAPEIYRALIEATAFGARKIIERIREYGVAIDRIVVCGGIADRSALTMQIYADVCAMPIAVSRSSQTSALGAAICGAVVGKAHAEMSAAVHAMTGIKPGAVEPRAWAVATYDRLYRLYLDLHDAFGSTGRQLDLSHLMKDLLAIRAEVSA